MNDSLTAPVAAPDSITYIAGFAPEDGWVCAQVAEVPEAISEGRTLEEAKLNVTKALEGALAGGSPKGSRSRLADRASEPHHSSPVRRGSVP